MHAAMTRSLLGVLAVATTQAAAADIDAQVFQFTARGCAPPAKGWVQTAFRARVLGRIGLVTALHGASGCKNYTSQRDDNRVFLDDLKMTYVDVARDVAFFTSAKLDADPSAPFGTQSFGSGDALWTIGYPQGTPSQLDYPLALYTQPRRRLDSLLRGKELELFQDRKSPDPAHEIIALRSILQAGMSGAPVFTQPGRRVVAVVNGGLRGGWTQINWAIPFSDIDWQPVGKVQQRLDDLVQRGATDLFATALEDGGFQQAHRAAATIVGSVRYAGRPLAATVPRADVVIDLMEIESRRNVGVEVSYDRDSGDFVIRGVPPGKYTPFVRAETGYPFFTESGGDYFGRISGMNEDIVVAPQDEGRSLRRDLEVIQVIHLRRPIDNQTMRTRIDAGPERLYTALHAPSAEVFEWEPVPGAVSYEATIHLMQPGQPQPLQTRTTTLAATTFRPGLAPTGGNSYYMFSVSAYGPARKLLGVFENYYLDGSGGWLEFTLAEPPAR